MSVSISHKKIRQLLLLLILQAGASPAAQHAFQDWAEVTDVEPVIEQHYQTVLESTCDRDAAEKLPVAGSIAADIRQQQRLWQSCRPVERQRRVQRISGYRVSYRFRGHSATRWMAHDPGRRLPIEVRLSASDR
jgi:hypothetical protein